MANKYKYSDVDIDFNKNEFIGDVSVKHDTNAVRQSVINIIMTRKGEKPFNRNFGVGIHDLLFENIGGLEIAMLEKVIASQFEKYEPRAGLRSVEWNTSKLDANSLDFEIKFVILTGPASAPIFDTLKLTIGKVR